MILLCGALASAALLDAPRAQQTGSQTTSNVADSLGLMPIPARMQFRDGRLAVTPRFSLAIAGHRDPLLERGVARFVAHLSLLTGMQIASTAESSTKATLLVEANASGNATPQLGEDESYTLDVDPSGARLAAPNSLGILHGLQTFLQLVEVTPDGFSLPAVHIEDRPRFPWRGLMIDVSRHFIPVEDIKRNLDGMEAVKLNVFHWHLSDDQGFRIESKTYPKLHELGSDGLYYTQEDVHDVIEYARERGIRVVPEFDIPGHSTSWFVGYPELSSTSGTHAIERRWGVFDPAMDPTREETYKFLEKFLAEMTRLFPDAYFHIGGDEVNGKQWESSPTIQAFMKAHGLMTSLELQQYFNARVEKIVEKNHKIMIGWDEILAPGLPENTVIQSWRGQDSLAAAARLGYRGILSNGYYLDLMWPAAQHYSVDPLGAGAANLSPDQAARILGGEACLWTEYVTHENVDSRIWPRTAAIAERLWSPQWVQDVPSMYERLAREDWRLQIFGLEHRSKLTLRLETLAGPGGVDSLRVLADAVEPVKGYSREHAAAAAGIEPTSADPLNRLVDIVPPESETARKFGEEVDALIAGGFADTAGESRVRAQMELWKANDTHLEPVLAASFLLKELSPLSADLAELGKTGLEALDAIDRGEQPQPEQRQQWTAQIAEAEKPQADLLLMVAPPIQKLVNASGSAHPRNEAARKQ
jgi:hexosaminidase